MPYYVNTRPRWPLVWYGTGDWCECRHYEKVSNPEKGIDEYEFIINPSLEVIERYRLEFGKQLDQDTGFVKKRYPETNVHILSKDPVLGRILITTTFDGKPTDLSRRDSYYTYQIEQLQKENKNLRSINARLNETAFASGTQRLKHTKDEVAIIKEARKAGGAISPEAMGMGEIPPEGGMS